MVVKSTKPSPIVNTIKFLVQTKEKIKEGHNQKSIDEKIYIIHLLISPLSDRDNDTLKRMSKNGNISEEIKSSLNEEGTKLKYLYYAYKKRLLNNEEYQYYHDLITNPDQKQKTLS